MPPLIGRKAIGCNSDLGRHNRFELIVRNFKEGKQLSNQHSYIALVDQRETQIKSSSSDTDIGIPETI
jgi:hypothetical protein